LDCIYILQYATRSQYHAKYLFTYTTNIQTMVFFWLLRRIMVKRSSKKSKHFTNARCKNPKEGHHPIKNRHENLKPQWNACWQFNGKILQFPYIKTVSTDTFPLTCCYTLKPLRNTLISWFHCIWSNAIEVCVTEQRFQLLSICSVGDDKWMKTVHWWNDADRQEPKYSKERPVSVPLCPPQIPNGQTMHSKTPL
jgi:hypothetical protein